MYSARVSRIQEGVSMGLILLVVIVILIAGSLPTWGHSRKWGYGPSGWLGFVLLVLLVLMLMNYIPRGI